MTLALSHVSKRVSRRFELKDVSFEVGGGEFLVLLGPSGCGKSSCLRLVAGLERLDQGTIAIGGTTVASPDVHAAPARRNLSMVFQSLALWPHMRARKQLDFVLKGTDLGRGARRVKAEKYLDLVGLLDRKRAYPHQLSGGEIQRLALARALVVEPSLVLLDEPLSAADRSLRHRLLQEIRSIQRELGIPMVYVTHDQEEALGVADRIVVMKGGRVEQVGTPREVYEGPINRFVAEFVGTNNVLLGTGRGPGGVETALGPVRCAESENGAAGSEGSQWIALRPEQIEIASEGVTGKVESGSYLGDRWLLTVTREEGKFFVLSGEPPSIGAQVHLRVKGEGRLLRESPSTNS